MMDDSNMARNSQCAKQVTIHQVVTMLATSKNVLFPPHNQQLTTGTDNPTLRQVISAGG